MEEKMKQEKLQTITLLASSVTWLKKNKEILVNGEPFDIKHYSLQGKYIIVSGLYDEQEKALKKKIQSGIEHSGRHCQVLKICFLAFYFQPTDATEILLPENKIVFPETTVSNPSELPLPVTVPPPRYTWS